MTIFQIFGKKIKIINVKVVHESYYMWHAIFGSLPQDNACHNIFGNFCQTSTTWNEHTTLISLIVETKKNSLPWWLNHLILSKCLIF